MKTGLKNPSVSLEMELVCLPHTLLPSSGRADAETGKVPASAFLARKI